MAIYCLLIVHVHSRTARMLINLWHYEKDVCSQLTCLSMVLTLIEKLCRDIARGRSHKPHCTKLYSGDILAWHCHSCSSRVWRAVKAISYVILTSQETSLCHEHHQTLLLECHPNVPLCDVLSWPIGSQQSSSERLSGTSTMNRQERHPWSFSTSWFRDMQASGDNSRLTGNNSFASRFDMQLCQWKTKTNREHKIIK